MTQLLTGTLVGLEVDHQSNLGKEFGSRAMVSQPIIDHHHTSNVVAYPLGTYFELQEVKEGTTHTYLEASCRNSRARHIELQHRHTRTSLGYRSSPFEREVQEAFPAYSTHTFIIGRRIDWLMQLLVIGKDPINGVLELQNSSFNGSASQTINEVVHFTTFNHLNLQLIVVDSQNHLTFFELHCSA